ncbi:MAG: helix-turn-helix domain-containing protein [Chloroflexota bacterium]
MTLFTIGDFAKLSQVSTHRLRNYDKQGLLHPMHTDQDTGYRYYSAEQLGTVNRIVALRDLDLSLEEIKSALTAEVDVEQMKQLLLQRQAELEEEIASKSNQLRQVQHRLMQIEEAAQLPLFEIIVKSLPSYSVVSMRQLVGHFDEIPYYSRVLHSEIHYALEKVNIAAQAPAMNLYHNRVFTRTNIELEACVVIPSHAMNKSLNSRFQLRRVKDVEKAATLVYSEDCEHIEVELAIMSLLQWSARAGYRVAGPMREIHHSPIIHSVKNQYGDSVAEFQLPIEKIYSQP